MNALVLASLAWAEPLPVQSVHASVVLKVGVPDEAADALVAAAPELGGWFQSRVDGDLSFRLPSGAVDDFLARAAALGVVAQRRFTSTELTAELEDARTRLAAREASLELYTPILAAANPKSVVTIERQMTQLVEEIEGLRGRIRFLEHQVGYAVVDVAFRFRDRRPPKLDGGSSFAWLNSLNLEEVVVDFQHDEAWWRTGPASPVAPDGFSTWHDRRFRAVSADGVLYRVRSARHTPRAELPFWKEALRQRMEAAGYTVAAEEEVVSGDVRGALLEVRAPLGEEDWAYLIVVYPVGGQLVLAEAAGEIAKMEVRKAALREAVATMGWSP